MNFSEFKKLIGADPWNRDAETLHARNSAPEFEAAAGDAEVFEQKLQAALNVQAPADLLEDITAITQQPAKRRNWIPLALAASVIIAVGAVGVAQRQSHQWDSVEAYVSEHYSHDGPGLLAQATNVVEEQDINEIMASLDASLGQQLSANVKLIKFCPTPEGRGAHMVLNTDQGPMTVIYMPKITVTDGELISFNQVQALLVNLEHGSVAIIGERSQNVGGLEALIRQSLKTGLIGA